MSKYEREILNTVHLRGTVSVFELARHLGVSDQTVRRIARPLVERGEIEKVHGALVSTRRAMDPPFLSRMELHRSAKVAIAETIADIVQDGDNLAIDTGSTSAFVAQALQARQDLTVVTNSAFVASSLSMVRGNRVFMAGTQLRDHDGAAFDRAAFDVIDRAQVDWAILSCSMVDANNGFLVHEQCEVDIAAAMLARAGRAIMAADASKFRAQDRKPVLRHAPLRGGDLVVTNTPPPPEYSAVLADFDLRYPLSRTN